jgi:hypothetical protein
MSSSDSSDTQRRSRQINLHDVTEDGERFHDTMQIPSQHGEELGSTEAYVSQQQAPPPKYPPHDIRAIMSHKGKSNPREVKMARIKYTISSSRFTATESLVDRGVNGGIAGQDVRVIATTDRTVDIQGIDNHQLTNVPVGTVAGVVQTNKGLVVAIMHQYAIVGRGHSVHSPAHWEWYKNEICDKSIHIGGKQRIKTAEGYLIPLSIVNGLPRLKLRPPTDTELNSLPHVMVTSDLDWNPCVLDFSHDENDGERFETMGEMERHPYHNLFDEYGNYRRRVVAQMSQTLARNTEDEFEDLVDECILHSSSQHDGPPH